MVRFRSLALLILLSQEFLSLALQVAWVKYFSFGSMVLIFGKHFPRPRFIDIDQFFCLIQSTYANHAREVKMRTYELLETSSGWSLTMYEDSKEVGGGVGSV